MSVVKFKLNDVVQVGAAGQRGKIVDIIRPLGTYEIYKVQLYSGGSILSAAKHQLVKGLPDEVLSLPQEQFDLDQLFDEFDDDFMSNIGQTSPKHSNGVLNSTVSLNTTASSTVRFQDAPQNLNQTCAPLQAVESSRFPEIKETIESYVSKHENPNTVQKTVAHQKLLQSFLKSKGELREIHQIPPAELDVYLAEFFMRVRQKNGSNYEATTLKGIQGSIQRFLNRHRYGYSIQNGNEFHHSRECFKAKKTELKRDGKGTKPKTSDEISAEEITYLYEKGQLGSGTQESILNTLWLNNTIHFGIRGGGTEHRQICWGDVQLNFDHDLKKEYLIFNERQTKTRTGQDITNVRLTRPRMYETDDKTRCPVLLYKTHSDKRPDNFSKPEDPFYLAPVTHNKHPQASEKWFLSLPVGKNKLCNIMKTMVKNAGLQTEKRLTNTSARKHLCQTLLRNEVPDAQAIQITGHKNVQSLNNYRALTNRQQHVMSNLLSGPAGDVNTTTIPQRVSTANVAFTSSQNIVHEHRNSDMSLQINSSPTSMIRSVFYGANIYHCVETKSLYHIL